MLKAVCFSQKIGYQRDEARAVFDLGPMTTVTKHMQLGVIDPLCQRQAGLQRDDFIFAAVNDQGRSGRFMILCARCRRETTLTTDEV